MLLKSFFKKHSHLFLLSYLPIYLSLFILVEQVNRRDYFVSYLPLDDYIPFIPIFVVPYVLWYPYMLVSAVLLLIKDIPAFKRFMYYTITAMSVSLLICFLFPNGQNLRIAEFSNTNLFTNLVSAIYSADTNTNVLPSMHVVGSLGVIFAAFDSKIFKRTKIFFLILGILICASTVFIKQHSILDVFAGVLLAAVTSIFVYVLPKRMFIKNKV